MIVEKIKEAMLSKSIKSKDLAEQIGITRSTMSLFINGKTKLSQGNIEKALKHLGIELVIK